MKNISKYLFTIIGFLILSAFTFQESNGDQILGTYLNEQGNAKIEIYEKSNKYFGRIIWVDVASAKDPKQAVKTIGMNILSNLEYKNGKWINGTIYSPARQESAKCSIQLSNNKKELVVSVSKGFLSTTKIWKRI